MELGATCCTKPTPSCESCPVRRHCDAFAAERTHELPRPRKRPESKAVHLMALLLRRRDELLLVRRRSGRLLQDWWELPTQRVRSKVNDHGVTRRRATARAHAADLQELAHEVRRRLHVTIDEPACVARVRHGILSHAIETDVIAARAPRGPDGSGRAAATVRDKPSTNATPLANLDLADLEVRWVKARECRALPLTTLARKSLRAVAKLDSAWSEYLDQNIGESSTDERRADPPA